MANVACHSSAVKKFGASTYFCHLFLVLMSRSCIREFLNGR